MALWIHAFGECGWIFDSLNAGTIDRKLEHTLVAEQDGRLVAAVDVFMREMRDGTGLPVKVGGIGSVATHESFRKQGLSGQLLTNAIDLMQREGCAWSLLFASLVDHYGKYGWVETPWRKYVCHGRKPYAPSHTYVIEGLGNSGPWPFEASARIYESFNAARPMCHVRTPLYWAEAIRVRLELPDRLTWVAHRDGKLQAYIVASVSPKLTDPSKPNYRAEITEWGCMPESTDALPDLVSTAIGQTRHDVSLRLPSDPVTDATIAQLFEEHRFESCRGPMSRPIAPDWSIERIKAMVDLPAAHCWDLDGF